MAGAPFSIEVFNAREEVLSSDVVRGERLASRDAQDVLRNAARDDEFRGTWLGTGNVINGADLLPTLVTAGSFNMTLGAGQIYKDDGTITGDDSPYQVVRWASQTVAFTAPDATNPRIDLIVATPGTESTDIASRNVLVDPVLRTVAAQNVPKTQNPKATITVVAGTAAAQPVAPAVPAGGMAIFEVFVPAAAASSAAFLGARRVFRRTIGVAAVAHGILKNCVPLWSDVDEASTTSVLTFPEVTHKVVINGEIIAFQGGNTTGGTLPLIAQDSLNNPITTAAPATADMPYYLYACGGRALPQARLNGLSTLLNPVVIVESLTAPDSEGRPSSAIATPRGNTIEAALYIGIAYIVKGTTGRRKAAVYANDWIYAKNGSNGSAFANRLGFNDGTNRLTGVPLTGGITITAALATRPSPATEVDLGVGLAAPTGAPVNIAIALNVPAATNTSAPLIAEPACSPIGAAGTAGQDVLMAVRAPLVTAPEFIVGPLLASNSLFLSLQPRGYNMNLPRIGR